MAENNIKTAETLEFSLDSVVRQWDVASAIMFPFCGNLVFCFVAHNTRTAVK